MLRIKPEIDLVLEKRKSLFFKMLSNQKPGGLQTMSFRPIKRQAISTDPSIEEALPQNPQPISELPETPETFSSEQFNPAVNSLVSKVMEFQQGLLGETEFVAGLLEFFPTLKALPEAHYNISLNFFSPEGKLSSMKNVSVTSPFPPTSHHNQSNPSSTKNDNQLFEEPMSVLTTRVKNFWRHPSPCFPPTFKKVAEISPESFGSFGEQ